MSVLICIGLVGAIRAQPAGPADGLLGTSLATALDTDLFTFFRLQEVWREQDAAKRSIVVFKPGGDSFRKLITLRATLDPSDRIVQLELALSRTFIDTGSTRIFANDIMRSTIRAAMARADIESLRPMLVDISQRPVPGMQRISLGPATQADLPAKESDGYLTYVGRRPKYTQNLSRSTLVIENLSQSDDPLLLVRLAARAEAAQRRRVSKAGK